MKYRFLFFPNLLAFSLMLFLTPFAQAEDLSVTEAVVATSVENLVPEGVAETFDAAVGKLYAFSRIIGAEGETTVKHLWFHEDNLITEVALLISSPNWRTYSSKKLLPSMTGSWRVDITQRDGTVLKSLPFTVE